MRFARFSSWFRSTSSKPPTIQLSSCHRSLSTGPLVDRIAFFIFLSRRVHCRVSRLSRPRGGVFLIKFHVAC